MATILGTGQFTITDINDAIISGTAPANPRVGALWIDSAQTPNVLKRWDGETWVIQNLSLEGLDPDANTDLENATTTLASLAADSIISKIERSYIKDKVTPITGLVLSDTASMPTLASLDAGTAGEVSSVRKEAIAVGILSSHASYIAVATEYTNLANYLNAMSPKPWNTTAPENISITVSDWRDKWQKYYEAILTLRTAISDKLKEAVEDITVEGRNLIPNSIGVLGLWTNSLDGTNRGKQGLKVTNTSTAERYAYHKRFTVEPNTNYTISGWIETSANCTGIDIFFLSRKATTTASVVVPAYDYVNMPISSKKSVGSMMFVQGTFLTRADEVDGYIRIDNNGSTDGLTSEAFFCELKMEKGLDATRWVEAPEDDAERIKQTADSIRDDLNLTSPLPTSVIMNADGITAMSTSDPNVFARLDYRGLYVQGGAIQINGGLPESQLSTSVKNDIASGVAAKTEAEKDNGLNKWVRRTYAITTPTATIPSYTHILAKTPVTETLVNDGLTLATGLGDNYVGLLKTAVYVATAKSISLTLSHDDGAQIYVNGKSVYTKSSVGSAVSITLPLGVGWNTLDFMWAEQSGGDGFHSFSVPVSTLVDKMSAYYAGDRGQLINLETIAGNAVQQDTAYNTVKINAADGLVAQRTDNKVKTTMNASEGFKIEKSTNNGASWTKSFYADTSGVLYANGLVIDGTMGSDLTSKQYIASRGENLVTNGSALLGNNVNFSSFTFDGAVAPAGVNGSFRVTGRWQTLFNDELIPVNPNETYRIKGMFKAGAGMTDHKFYFGIACYDIDGQVMSPSHYMYFPGTLTTLAQDLKPGDTVIKLTSAAGWQNAAGTSTHNRRIVFWNYKNSFGYQYPPETYSRYVSDYDIWADGSVDVATNTITLRAPWAGSTYVAGTQVSNGSSGANYKYTAAGNALYPADWTEFSGVLSGIDVNGGNSNNRFAPGTASVKLLWLTNRDTANTANATTYMAGIEFAKDGLVAGKEYNGVKVDGTNGIVVTSSKNILTMNASKGIELKRTSDSANIFSVDGSGNLSVSGNITMTAGSKLDASYITTGTLNADRIGSNTITAQKIAIGDFTNISQVNEVTNPLNHTIVTVNNLKYFKVGQSAYMGITLNSSKSVDFKVGDEFYLGLNGYKEAGVTGLILIARYYYSDGTYSNAGTVSLLIGTNPMGATDSYVERTLKVTAAPTVGKTVSTVNIFLEKDSGTTGYYYLRNIELRKKYTGSLIVDGSIVASHISSLNGLNAAGGNFVIDTNGNVTVKGTLELNGTSKIGSTNASTVESNASKGAAAYNLRTKGVGMKVDYSSFTATNAGEVYVHGFDSNGNAADVDGYLVVNGVNMPVPKQMINPDAVVNGYITFDKVLNKWYVSYPQEDGTTWYRVDAGITNGTFTPDANHFFCGTIKTTTSESNVQATLWNDYKDYIEMETYRNVVLARYNIDNLSLGGRNYALDTATVKTGASVLEYQLNRSKLEELIGKPITISFEAKAEGDGIHYIDSYLRDDGSSVSTITKPPWLLDGTYKRFSYTITMPDTTARGMLTIAIRGNASPDASNAGSFTIRNMKVESGNRMSDWSPAPEDVYDDLRMPAGEYLPNSILLDRNGITATTDTDAQAYARLDNRGLYVAKGAVQIDTGTSGVKIDGTNGIVVDNALNTLTLNASKGLELKKKSGSTNIFSLDASGNLSLTGNITMTAGSTLNASYITAGTLSASRIATGSITADKVNAKGLTVNNGTKNTLVIDASGNVTLDGNITMGTGSTLSAAYITSGTLSADRIGANTITAEKLAVGSVTAEKLVVGAGVTGDGNLLAGKTSTGTYVSTEGTNGTKNIGSPYISFGAGNASDTGAESAFVQYDLGAVYRIEESRAYFFSGDDRSYWYKITYSADGTNWNYAVGNGTTSGWKKSIKKSVSGATEFNPTIDRFSVPISARYVRLYANGNTVNTTNHIYEWEMYSYAQTQISGDSIVTGKISADRINAKGLSVLDGSGNETFKVDSSGNVTIRGTVNIVSGTIGNTNATTVESNANNAKSQIDNLKIGVRNLVPGTDLSNDEEVASWVPWNANTNPPTVADIMLTSGQSMRFIKVTSLAGLPLDSAHGYVSGDMDSNRKFAVVAGKEYTLSFLTAAHPNTKPALNYTYLVYDGLPSNQKIPMTSITSSPVYGDFTDPYALNVYEYSITFTADTTCPTTRLLIGGLTSNNFTGTGSHGLFYVSNIQLEEGNRKSQWTPSPEDTKNDLNTAVATITEEYQTAIATTAADITTTVTGWITDSETEITTKYETAIQSTKDSIDLTISEVTTDVNNLNDSMTQVQTYFKFQDTGLNIGKSDSPLNINISNSQMDFIDNGNIVAYINGQKMYIESLQVLTELVVGNHKIEKSTDGMTLINFVG